MLIYQGTTMQLNIKNDEAYRLAQEIAARTGESLTEAVTRALRERLERETTAARLAPQTKAERLERLRAAAARFDALPVLDPREPDAIVGYDENGLPGGAHPRMPIE
jgi:antitoxin VapB